MRPVKYFPLARAIKLFTQFGFLFTVIAIVFNLVTGVFNLKPYFELGGFTFGHITKGYNVGANLNLRIPDTIVYSQNGYQELFEDHSRRKLEQQDTVRQKIVNKIEHDENNDIKISNWIYTGETVGTRVYSNNWKYNLFWSITAQLDLLFSALVFLILVKLCNRYMDQEIFEERTFKLIAFLGWLFIVKEIFNFVISFVNGLILEHPQLRSFSTVGPGVTNYMRLELDFYKVFSFSSLCTGILIVMLAEVFKTAILAKKENEMTI